MTKDLPPVTKPFTWADMEEAIRKMSRRPDNSAYFTWLEEAYREFLMTKEELDEVNAT